MKATQSLLALAILAAAGSANAATVATYNVTNAVTITGLASGSFTETGTAVLDDSGSLTIEKTGLNSTNNGNFTLTSRVIWNGAYNSGANSLTISSGTVTNLACTAGTSACSANLQIGTPTALTATPATGTGGGLPTPNVFDGTAGGVYNTTVYGFNRLLTTASVMTFTNTTPPPAVPVPAAAWLFGSGLFGLIGAARRRRATAA